MRQMTPSISFRFVGIFMLSIPLFLGVQWLLLSFFLQPLDEQGLWVFAAWSNFAWFAVLTGFLLWMGWIYLVKNQWPYFTIHLRRHLFMIMLGVFLLILFNLLSVLFLEAMGLDLSSTNQEAIIAMANAGINTRMALLVAGGFLAPFVEELVFRKGFMDIFSRRVGIVGAILLSSLLFGFLHVLLDLDRLYMILPYALSGVVLGFIYVFSNKNIFIPIFVHASYNLIGLMILILPLQERFSGI